MARLLLLIAFVMCASSCPIPPDAVAVNNPPYIVEGALIPANTGLVGFDCSQTPKPTLEFSVANAVEDPDVYDDIDTMFIVWYVSTNKVDVETGLPEQDLVLREEPSFPLTCSTFVDFFPPGSTILTAYILDRAPVSTTDEAVKIPGPDGFAVSVSWTVEKIEE